MRIIKILMLALSVAVFALVNNAESLKREMILDPGYKLVVESGESIESCESGTFNLPGKTGNIKEKLPKDTMLFHYTQGEIYAINNEVKIYLGIYKHTVAPSGGGCE